MPADNISIENIATFFTEKLLTISQSGIIKTKEKTDILDSSPIKINRGTSNKLIIFPFSQYLIAKYNAAYPPNNEITSSLFLILLTASVCNGQTTNNKVTTKGKNKLFFQSICDNLNTNKHDKI